VKRRDRKGRGEKYSSLQRAYGKGICRIKKLKGRGEDSSFAGIKRHLGESNKLGRMGKNSMSGLLDGLGSSYICGGSVKRQGEGPW